MSDYERARHAVGYTYLDAIHLRMGEITHPPDIIVYPKNEADVVKLVDFCAKTAHPHHPLCRQVVGHLRRGAGQGRDLA